MLSRRSASFAILLAAIAPSFALAEDFPTRSVRLIVPYAAGGGTDAIARVFAQVLGDKLGQTVIVENVSTGSGNAATRLVATAAPNGYTILMANQGPIAVNPHMMQDLNVDTIKAFSPITQIATAPLVAVVPANSPYKTFGELIDGAKKNPGKLTYGSAGNGSASHVAVLALNRAAGIDTVHVPYRGAGPAIVDLMGNQSQFMLTTFPSVVSLIETGKVRALAVTTKTRSPLLKDVPSIAESGLPDFEASAWYGLVVPAGTPQDIIEKLRKTSVESLGDATLRSRLTSDGATAVGNSSAEFGQFMQEEVARWKDIVRAANIKIE